MHYIFNIILFKIVGIKKALIFKHYNEHKTFYEPSINEYIGINTNSIIIHCIEIKKSIGSSKYIKYH